MVGYIVDRLHASTPPRDVVREVIRALKGRTWRDKYRRWRAVPRTVRRELLREVLERHEHNRELYRAVMSGRLF